MVGKVSFGCLINWDFFVLGNFSSLQRMTDLQQEAAFARRKRRKAAGGKRKGAFPPSPSCPCEAERAAAMSGGSGCRGLLELPQIRRYGSFAGCTAAAEAGENAA